MGSPDVLLAAADRALYRAKGQGGNLVFGLDPAPRARPVTRTSEPGRTVRPPAESGALESRRVLLVDDEPATLRATRRILEHLGCEVVAVESSREALCAVQADAPIDVLVTDIVMPEMSGFTLVDLAMRVREGLPVLYVSAYPQEEVYWGGTPGARSAFLGKPMEIGDLQAALVELLTPNGSRPAAVGMTLPRASLAPPEADSASAAGVRLEGRIMIVDDDQAVAESLQRLFRRTGYAEPLCTTEPAHAFEMVHDEGVDLVILDLHMPEMDGFQVMAALAPLVSQEEYLPILVLTGDDDPSVRRRALAAGAMDFLSKPCDPAEAQARVRNLLATRQLYQRVARQRDELEDRVMARTAELADTRTEILHRLARAAEYRDDITGRHAERVGLLSSLIGAEMGMNAKAVDLLRRTAPLHDIGKIGVPDAVLRKPGRLTEAELDVMKTHTTIGEQILGGSTHRILAVASAVAVAHHERWDGSGYPHGLEGEDIPIEARIVSVADVFDTLAHARPYKKAFPLEDAMAEIQRCRGSQFDPDVVDAFTSIGERTGLQRILELADPLDPLRDTTG